MHSALIKSGESLFTPRLRQNTRSVGVVAILLMF
jgi:hypothetical protein